MHSIGQFGEIKQDYLTKPDSVVYISYLRHLINQYTFSNLLNLEVKPMESAVKTDSKGRKTVVNACTAPCAIEKGMRLIGGKWKASIIYHLKDQPVRFNDLTRLLGGASKKMVDQRLKELESEGMVLRKVISDRPVAVTYELTEFGKTALGILNELRAWSESHQIA